MEIQKSNNINFGARFINPANIKVKNSKGYWKDVQVSLIKFEPAKKEDITVLERISRLWGGKNLSANVVEEASILGGKTNIYGLTAQLDNFDEIDPFKVLGLMSTGKVTKGQNVEIFKIGTNPKFAYEQNRRIRDVKHIAKTMTDSLKSLVKSKSKNSNIFVRYADPEDIKFLSRIGLEPLEKDTINFINK